jgi:hypothetical protein
MSLKNPVTPPGIDSGTVRIVAQHFNHYATAGPQCIMYLIIIIIIIIIIIDFSIIWRSRCALPFDLHNRSRREVGRFSPWLFYPQGNSPCYL